MKYLIAIILLTNALVAQEMPFGIKFQTPFEKTHEILSSHEDCISSEDLIIFNNYEFKKYMGEKVKQISTLGLNSVISYLNIEFDVTPETINDVHKRIRDQLAERVYHFDTSNTKNGTFTECWSYSQKYNYLEIVLTKEKVTSNDSCKISLTYWYEPKSYFCFIDNDELFGIDIAAQKDNVLANLDLKGLYYDEVEIKDNLYTVVCTNSICEKNVIGGVFYHFNKMDEIDQIIIKLKEEDDNWLYRFLKIQYNERYGKGEREQDGYYWQYETFDHQYSVWMGITKPGSFLIIYQF
jgi:hypothetical protein